VVFAQGNTGSDDLATHRIIRDDNREFAGLFSSAQSKLIDRSFAKSIYCLRPIS
jgi:hypothetical protein